MLSEIFLVVGLHPYEFPLDFAHFSFSIPQTQKIPLFYLSSNMLILYSAY